MQWRWRLEVHQCPINLLPESGDPQSYTCRQQHGVLREQCNQYAPGKECSANVMENHWLIPIISDILCHAGSSGCSSSLAPSIHRLEYWFMDWMDGAKLELQPDEHAWQRLQEMIEVCK